MYMSVTVLLKKSINILEEPAAYILCIAGDCGFLQNTDIFVPPSVASLSKKTVIFTVYVIYLVLFTGIFVPPSVASLSKKTVIFMVYVIYLVLFFIFPTHTL